MTETNVWVSFDHFVSEPDRNEQKLRKVIAKVERKALKKIFLDQ